MKTSSQFSHTGNERQIIRELEHRIVGSRQPQKPVERSNHPRQPKTGGTGGHGKKRAD
jgi:hypothetical protein